MITGAPTSPMVTRGRSVLRESLSANLQFAAGDGRGRRDLRNLRSVDLEWFPKRHN